MHHLWRILKFLIMQTVYQKQIELKSDNDIFQVTVIIESWWHFKPSHQLKLCVNKNIRSIKYAYSLLNAIWSLCRDWLPQNPQNRIELKYIVITCHFTFTVVLRHQFCINKITYILYMKYTHNSIYSILYLYNNTYTHAYNIYICST